MTAIGIVAIVPMKPLRLAKSRLAAELTKRQRAVLTRNLMRRVLRAIKGSAAVQRAGSLVDSVWVVGGDADICQIAKEEGAAWYEEIGSDINETLGQCFERAFEAGKAAIFMPGDLPFLKPADIDGMVGASGNLKNLILAPARQGKGTNGILVPPELCRQFRPMLGPESFTRHLSQAASLGLPVAIYYSQGLGFDLDTLEDLKAYEYIEPGLFHELTGGND